jgi:TetR/AcrR family transcriptional regulator, cholesterol catabolism regulator
MVPADRNMCAMTQNATSEAAGSDSRRLDIIRAAARLFAARGYAGTSMRDIAAAVGMLPGSLYYHFPSKEVLIEQIFIVGSQTLSAAVEVAVAEQSDPWARLEQACVTHLEAHLSDNRFAAAIATESLRLAPALRARLVTHLDRYEALFAAMVQELDLPPEIDRSIYRLSLLSTLNAVEFWYHPGGRTPDYIARQIFAIYDHRQSRRG